MNATKSSLLQRAYHELIGYSGALRGFRAECAEAFGYLVGEFGFRPLVFEETGYGALCRFESATTVVENHLDWSEELIFVYVRPAADSGAANSVGPPGVLLDAIMVHRGERPAKQEKILKRERMRSTLQDYGRALRAHAPEALRGDFRELISVRRTRPEANWRQLRPRP